MAVYIVSGGVSPLIRPPRERWPVDRARCPRRTMMNREEQTVPALIIVLIAITIAIGAVLAATSFIGTSSQAIPSPCSNVPAGWSCVPLVNKPQSGPGVTSPALGDLLYKFPRASTPWVVPRDLAGVEVD